MKIADVIFAFIAGAAIPTFLWGFFKRYNSDMKEMQKLRNGEKHHKKDKLKTPAHR